MITSTAVVCADERSGWQESHIVPIYNKVKNIQPQPVWLRTRCTKINLATPERNKVKVPGEARKMKRHGWISVNLCDPLPAQMRMDGGIPDALIGRWMSVQLWL